MKAIWSKPQWAQSANGNAIALYGSEALSSIAQKAPIIFIGGVHGDEPEGVMLAEQWLAWLNNANNEDRNEIHHETTNDNLAPWLLITCINPDGYQANCRTNGNGVDLNRNFPSACWCPSETQDRYYPGKHAGSEPEVAALVELFSLVKARLIVHFHSWEPSIVYSNIKAKWAADLLAKCSGYLARPDIGYPTPGSLGEYGGNDLDIGVICIEEQEGIELATTFPRFKAGLVDILYAT
ncbi:DUF2817 domain-containing protein [Colwellia sp. MEBiC06753]